MGMFDAFTKGPSAKIEGLEDQIKKERMKLVSKEEKIKADVQEAGGIQAIRNKIREAKDNLSFSKVAAGVGVVGTAVCAVGLCELIGITDIDGALGLTRTFHNPQAENTAFLFFAGTGVGFVSAAAVGSYGMVKNWWEKKNLENLKGESEMLGAAI